MDPARDHLSDEWLSGSTISKPTSQSPTLAISNSAQPDGNDGTTGSHGSKLWEKSLYQGSGGRPAVYNADVMEGLPLGVQVVGQRLEEEKVLAGMRLVEQVMKERGKGYELLTL